MACGMHTASDQVWRWERPGRHIFSPCHKLEVASIICVAYCVIHKQTAVLAKISLVCSTTSRPRAWAVESYFTTECRLCMHVYCVYWVYTQMRLQAAPATLGPTVGSGHYTLRPHAQRMRRLIFTLKILLDHRRTCRWAAKRTKSEVL